MVRASRKAFINITQILFDLLGVALSFIITYSIVSFLDLNQILIAEKYYWILLIYLPVFILSMYSMEMYNLSTINYTDRNVKNVLFACLLATFFCLVLSLYIQDNLNKYRFLGWFVLFSAVILSLERWLSQLVLRKLPGHYITRIIVVGNAAMIKNYLYFLNKTSFRYEFVGYVLVKDDKEGLDSTRLLGYIQSMHEILNSNVVDEVIFSLPRSYMGEVEKYLMLCEERGLTVKLVLDLFDLKNAKTNLLSVGNLPVLTYHTVCLNRSQLIWKRIIDIFGSLIGLTVLSLASVFIIPAIKLDSKGPIFFKQKRVGQNGREFYLYKFRSMCCDAEVKKAQLMEKNKVKDGYMFKIDNDPRVTRLGAFLRKTSLDELPQFINVLKGDMSLVGTRPPTVDEVKKYKNLHYRRISIKPGITGMWQVSGRSDITDFEEVVRLDVYYIDNWSVWKDITILFKTVFVLLFKNRGAY
jgi:exopolysaccharide biosynthesis polyprenyl glycosylphosphotransferase